MSGHEGEPESTPEAVALHLRADKNLSDQEAAILAAHIFFPEDLVPLNLARRAAGISRDGFAFVFHNEDCLMVLLNP